MTVRTIVPSVIQAYCPVTTVGYIPIPLENCWDQSVLTKTS